MSLLELAETNPSAFESYNIQQIVAICGGGKLTDKSECSAQLRRFLSIQKNSALEEYASYCLENAFPKSGAVLQDVVNEIGRRIGYDVTNGRYSSSRDIGFDGLWKEGKTALIVEVKTTDAYRINLDTVVAYAQRAYSESLVETRPTALLIVGRQDTGDLEAQIRGSRHAWQLRLVSIDSLIKLMLVGAEISAATFIEKVRRILLPIEYTRVDDIIDLVFETRREAEETITEADESQDETESREQGSGWVFTPTQEIDAKRDSLLGAFYRKHGGTFRRVTRAKYVNDERKIRVACSVSKRYTREHQPYWYAFHPAWLEFLEQGSSSYFILGCMDRDDGFAIPLAELKNCLDKLYRTEKEEKFYWHITLAFDERGVFLNLPKTGEKLYLEQYVFSS